MTLYDVNTFLKYIAEVKGPGSRKEKPEKILEVVQKVSKLEGLYFLRIIDHNLTIGAKAKTFKKAKVVP